MAHDEQMPEFNDGVPMDEKLAKIEAILAETAELQRQSEQRSREHYEAFQESMSQLEKRMAAPPSPEEIKALIKKYPQWADFFARQERIDNAINEFLVRHPEGAVALMEKLAARP